MTLHAPNLRVGQTNAESASFTTNVVIADGVGSIVVPIPAPGVRQLVRVDAVCGFIKKDSGGNSLGMGVHLLDGSLNAVADDYSQSWIHGRCYHGGLGTGLYVSAHAHGFFKLSPGSAARNLRMEVFEINGGTWAYHQGGLSIELFADVADIGG